MKKILLPFIIIKNICVIICEEIWSFARKKPKAVIAVILLIFLALGISYYFKGKNGGDSYGDLQKLTLEKAAREGEKTTLQLLIQIEKPKGNSDDASGRHERGDVVLTAPADKEFSIAEKEGFLILKMDLTPKQVEILTLPMEEKINKKDPEGNPIRETLKRRKFAVDLGKIGISEDDEKGRVLEDKIYTWDILYQK